MVIAVVPGPFGPLYLDQPTALAFCVVSGTLLRRKCHRQEARVAPLIDIILKEIIWIL